jgi:glycine/D-amino acid oxidase-like deaminating enzyme
MSIARTNEADVIVIGGGIMGTTTAFFLRQRNRSVILLERGLTGQQASGVNFGGIRRQGRALPQLAMANRALRTWQRSAEMLGEDIEFLASGHTRVCYHQKDVENFDQYAMPASTVSTSTCCTAMPCFNAFRFSDARYWRRRFRHSMATPIRVSLRPRLVVRPRDLGPR